jgi:hypothetical protein
MSNAAHSLQDILNASSYLKEKRDKNEINIVPAFYDTRTGKVTFN